MSWLITGSEKTQVDPQFGSVSLLLHGDGTNGSTTITDSSPSPKTVTAVGNAQISTAQSKFGGASIAFDGNGDYLLLGGESAFVFGTQDFTIELWYFCTSAVIFMSLYDTRVVSGFANFCTLYLADNDGNATYQAGAFTITTTGASLNAWNHLAVTRSSSSTRLFLNGSQQGSTTADSSDYQVGLNRPIIGANRSLASPFAGYIDDLRVTKGIARYTANFTPPTAPFPDI